MHSIFSHQSPFSYSKNNYSSASMLQKVPGVVRTGSIPPKSPGIVCGSSLSFILYRPCNRSIIGSYPSLKIGPCSPRVPDRNPIMMSPLFPPATPAVKVFVLKEPPLLDPAEIALKVLKREDSKVREMLVRERHRNLQANPSHVVNRSQLISPSISFLFFLLLSIN